MGLVMIGVLNAPYPDDPAEIGVVEWTQARSAMREAAAHIIAIEARVKAAEKIAGAATVISCRPTSPVTGGRVILEADVISLAESVAAFRATGEQT